MEIHYDEASSQFITTEKILPRMLMVEESYCFVCARMKKFYCCRQCFEAGDPSFLTQLAAEDEKKKVKVFPGMVSGVTKVKIAELQEWRKKLAEVEKSAIEASSSLARKQELITSIVLARKRVQALKQLHQLVDRQINDLRKQKTSLRSSIEQLGRRKERIQLKKTKITDYINTKKTFIEKTKKSVSKEHMNLETVQREQIQDLVTHIFPLVGVQQDESYDSDDSACEDDVGDRSLDLVEKEIAEARRLSFVHGRWIYDQREGPDVVRISIASSRVLAPTDGNYAACETWLKSLLSTSAQDNEEGSSPSSSVVAQAEPHKSRGASNYAALYFSAQLLHTVRKILCVFVPYKLHFKTFSNQNMTVQQFLWNVRKLNGNVLALCLHYGVDPQLLHPLHTLPNVQNALQMFLHNGENASRSLLTPQLVTSLEEALEGSSDPLPEDEEDRLEESLSEWEVSLHEEDWDSLAPKMSSIAQNQYVSAAFHSQAQQDDMGQSHGLVSSAVGWLTKNWWNR